ncbi:hypothetical protein [Pandoraea faecigallinarum]|nr:hypothetical protein [Pandoraea faecigallinarum]
MPLLAWTGWAWRGYGLGGKLAALPVPRTLGAVHHLVGPPFDFASLWETH